MTMTTLSCFVRGLACVSVCGLATTSFADLTGTSFDVSVSHTGQFATTSTNAHTYGTMQTEPDPEAPAFTMDWISPSPNGTARENSFLIDFTDFSLGDFDGETGSIEISNIAENVDSGSVAVLDGMGQVIATGNASGNTITASWDVHDVLPFVVPTVTIAWNSESAIQPQPAAGDPLAGLSPTELERFELGKVAFERTFLAEEGLGPVFNKASCANCHNNPIGGSGAQTVTRFGVGGKGGFDDLAAFGGSLLQASAISIDCLEEVHPSANVFSLRLTPSVLGGGLIEAIDDADILAGESAGPDVSGVARIVNPLESPLTDRVGRFGWKGDVATLLTFAADAGLNEIGITNRLVMTENDPNGINPPDLADCDNVPDPEDGPEGGVPGAPHWIDRTNDFQRFLAAPPQTPKSGMSGEAIFVSIGCAQCHTQEFTTPDNLALEDAIRNRTIRPYSDFLIHDMGLAADFIPSGDAGEREMRTPALWGLAAGTFENRVTDAILEHGALVSEGQPSAQAFSLLPQNDKDALIAFLQSLGRREFDADIDNVIDEVDFANFNSCVGGGYTPDDPCSIHDIDQDGDVDGEDFESFLLVYNDVNGDCNQNGVEDLSDIVFGGSNDANGNAIPDVCDCPADCVPPGGNGVVNIDDILATINAFGTVGDSACDSAPDNGDGTFGNGLVNIDDVLRVINSQGPCF